jgi:hypothetical protein
MLKHAIYQSCPSTPLMRTVVLMRRALVGMRQRMALGQQQLLALTGRAHGVQLLGVVAGAAAEAGRRPALLQERAGVAELEQQDAVVAAGAGARGEEGSQHCKQKKNRRMKMRGLLRLT